LSAYENAAKFSNLLFQSYYIKFVVSNLFKFEKFFYLNVILIFSTPVCLRKCCKVFKFVVSKSFKFVVSNVFKFEKLF